MEINIGKFYIDSRTNRVLIILEDDNITTVYFDGLDVNRDSNIVKYLEETKPYADLEEKYTDIFKIYTEIKELEKKKESLTETFNEKKQETFKFVEHTKEYYRTKLGLDNLEEENKPYKILVTSELVRNQINVYIKLDKLVENEYSSILGFNTKILEKTKKDRINQLASYSFGKLLDRKLHLESLKTSRYKTLLNISENKMEESNETGILMIKEKIPMEYNLNFTLDYTDKEEILKDIRKILVELCQNIK